MSQCSITCRTCGNPYLLPEGEVLCECGACGTVNERPHAQGEALDKLQRATRLRLKGEYALAEKCYNAVLAEYEEEHEALWGRVLCHYGVEIVLDDHPGGQRHLIVHIPRRTMMQESADFQQAFDMAPPEIRAQYEQDAAYVDEAQAEIRQMAENCQPYDVFLCHKTTVPGTDQHTADYDRAFKLYHGLAMKGFRVFFAPVELQGRSGANYEAGIYHALHTSRVMLVFCSDPEYVASTWVQSEWRRYLELMGNEEDDTPRTLRPLLYDKMPARKLPAEFLRRKLQAITMDEFGSDENVTAVVEQFCGARKAAPAEPVREPADAPAPESHFTMDLTQDGEVAVTGYKGPGGVVEIPSVIGGRPVVMLADRAFENQAAITKVIMPQSLKFIANYTFIGCRGLTEVEIPEGVKIVGNYAFAYCTGLRRVNIPEGVSSMGVNPFAGCTFLKEVTVSAGNKAYSARDGVLISGGNELICYPAGRTEAHYAIPQDVKVILASAFQECSSLKTVDMPEGVTQIGYGAFARCSSLTDLTIPVSVTEIGDEVFAECSRLTLHVYADSPAARYAQQHRLRAEVVVSAAPESHFTTEPVEGGVSITGYTGPGGEIIIPAAIGGQQVVEIGRQAFYNQEKITSVTIPEGVRSIGFYVFNGCGGLSSVSIPGGVTVIDDGAFGYCSALTEVAIPDSVVRIGDDAFCGCGIASVALSASVTDIGINPFGECAALRQITVAEENPAYYASDNVLMSRRNELVCYPMGLTRPGYTIPKGITVIGAAAFQSCKQLTSISIPDSVTVIEACAFRDCEGLKRVTIPEGVTALKDSAFLGCEGLTGVIVPASVTTIESDVFRFCPHITLYVHPNSTAHKYAVERGIRCGSMEAASYAPEEGFTVEDVQGGVRIRKYTGPGGPVHIPPLIGGKRVLEIGAKAFEGRNGVSRIVIPNGVTTIGESAFLWCTGLTELTIPDTLVSINGYAFMRCSSLRKINVSAGNPKYCVKNGVLMSREGELVLYPTGLNDASFDVPEGVVAIGACAFNCCIGLKSIIIPQSVTQIGPHAFVNCTNLTEITLPEHMVNIGGLAFSHCLSLASINIPSLVRIIRTGTFYDCPSLTSLTIPAGVTAIEIDAFKDCASLTLHVYENSAAHQHAQQNGIPFELMSGSEVLESHFATSAVEGGVTITGYTGPGGTVKIPETIGGQRVLGIGVGAFNGQSGIARFVLPEGLVSIGDRAFSWCTAITEIEIPASVSNIVGTAFMRCANLQRITIAEGNPTYYVRGNVIFSRQGALICYPAGLPATGYVVPDGVAGIAHGAFNCCMNLQSITLPDSCLGIGPVAFLNCPNLTSINLPEKLAVIEQSAFHGCAGLTTLTIPAGTGAIGKDAFNECSALTLRVYQGTAAHRYAQENKLRFEVLAGRPVVHEELIEPAESCFVTKPVGDGVIITGYSGPGGAIRLPAFIGGLRLRGLAAKVFEGQQRLTRLVIPEGVIAIGDQAFSWCINLMRIDIPSTVCSIEPTAFLRCTGLREITVAQGNEKYYMQQGVLMSRDNGLICYPPGRTDESFAVPDGVTYIAACAFNCCAEIRRITIPASVTSIGFCAFILCKNLNSVNIPAGVTAIDGSVFYGCASLRALLIPDGVAAIGDQAFKDCTGLGSLTIPARVSSIEDKAFEGCTGLTLHVHENSFAHRYAQQKGLRYAVIGSRAAVAPESHFYTSPGAGGVIITAYTGPGGEVVIPATIGGQRVVQIGEKAFGAKNTLTRVVIPEGVKIISYMAFMWCSSLESVSLPASLEYILKGAFMCCASLREITVAQGNPKYYVRDGVLMSILNVQGQWCHSADLCPAGLALTDYTVPDGIVNIGDCAFVNCTSLRRINLPATLIRIGDLAFQGCTSLTEIRIPDAVIAIGEYAFGDCSSLRSLTIPAKVTEISKMMCKNCTSLTSLTLPAGVRKIDGEAFVGCTKLTLRVHANSPVHQYAQQKGLRFEVIGGPVVAPESHFITQPMEGGVAITGYKGPGGEVVIPEIIGGQKVVWIGEKAFEAKRELTKVVVPEGVIGLGLMAFVWCTNLKSVSLPASIATVYEGAFLRCSSLQEITVADGNPKYSVRDGVLMSTAQIYSIRRYAVECYPAGLPASDYAIPEGVTDIGGGAFGGCVNLKNITIPSSVVRIWGNAFLGCTGLKNLTIPSGVETISGCAFYLCSGLENVTIPDSVTELEEKVFVGCTALTSLTIPASVAKIGEEAFNDCPNLTLRVRANSPAHQYAQQNGLRFEVIRPAAAPESHFATEMKEDGATITGYSGPGGAVVIPATIRGQNVRRIGNNAFAQQTAVTEVVIPEGVINIGERTFAGCENLTSISIPASMKDVRGDAFIRCPKLKEINVAPGGEVYYSHDHMLMWRMDVVFTVINKLACHPAGLKTTSYTIADYVTDIGHFAFSGCDSLTSLTIPAGIVRIWDGAFSGCSGLKSITIPYGVDKICSATFQGCTGLTNVTLPDSVAAIAENAFRDCRSLMGLIIPTSVTTIADGAFDGCTGLTLGVYENSAAHQYAQQKGLRFKLLGPAPAPESHFDVTQMGWREVRIDKYVGPGGEVLIPAELREKKLTAIESRAFASQKALMKVVIPDSVTDIGDQAFAYCPLLASVTLPSGLKAIPHSVFRECASLTSIDLPNGLTIIPFHAFRECASLRSIEIPSSVTIIAAYAFGGCTNLSGITLPEGLTEIGGNAFEGCTSLTSLTIPESVTTIKADAFKGCPKLVLRVHPKSAAFYYAKSERIRYEVIGESPKTSFFSRLFGRK